MQFTSISWQTLGMSPKIDDERGPIPMVLGEGIRTYEHNQNSILEKGVIRILRTYKFIDIYANVPLLVALG